MEARCKGANMRVREVHLTNSWGLHARLAAKIALLASQFTSSVQLGFNGRTANARSIIAVMLLAAGAGVAIRIETSGADEMEALEALSELIGGQQVSSSHGKAR
jgi:phosphocarrier protein HPr